MDIFWPTLAGAAVGVAAGAVIQFLAQKILDASNRRARRRSFVRELRFNLIVLSNLLQETNRLRSAVHGQNFSSYNGYIRASLGLFLVTNQIASSGEVYDLLNDADLSRMQQIVALLSLPNEKWINDQIHQYKAGPATVASSQGIGFVDYIEKQFTECRDSIGEIIEKIERR